MNYAAAAWRQATRVSVYARRPEASGSRIRGLVQTSGGMVELDAGERPARRFERMTDDDKEKQGATAES